MAPKFSIVIPTRRPRPTLLHTLRTVVAQEFDDVEIVVSDNSQSGAAAEIVAELDDERLEVVATPRALSMIDSWNFAFEHARGEYVTLLGDDDGLLLHALPAIDEVVSALSPRLVQWNSVTYWWPDVPATHAGTPNELVIPVVAANSVHNVAAVDARSWIKDAISFKSAGMSWPNIRCSFAHRSLIAELRRRTGVVFRAEAPDAYSAFALASLVDEFHRIEAPMEVFGFSGGSTNIGVLFLNGRSASASDFEQLNAEAAAGRHPDAPRLPVGAALHADAFLRAKEALFPDAADLVPDRRLVAARSLIEARPANSDEWIQMVRCVRETLRGDTKLEKWFDSEWSSMPISEHVEKHVLARDRGYYPVDCLSLDATEFGVTDVFGAAELVEKLFGYRRLGLNWRATRDSAAAKEGAREAWIRRRWHGFLDMTGLMEPYVGLRARLRGEDPPARHDPLRSP